jgi:hypothetical protein
MLRHVVPDLRTAIPISSAKDHFLAGAGRAPQAVSDSKSAAGRIYFTGQCPSDDQWGGSLESLITPNELPT